MEKTIEEKKAAVLAECERLFEGKPMWSRVSIGNDAVIYKGINKYDLCQVMHGGYLGNPYLTVEQSMSNFDSFLAYSILGLESRALREELEAEKAASAKLVEALTWMNDRMKSEDWQSEENYPVFLLFEEHIRRAIAAHKKGATT